MWLSSSMYLAYIDGERAKPRMLRSWLFTLILVQLLILLFIVAPIRVLTINPTAVFVLQTSTLHSQTRINVGNQKRYQQWFQTRFLPASGEHWSLIPDLLRYCILCHHPTNQQLQSRLLPRWAVAGWLLKCW